MRAPHGSREQQVRNIGAGQQQDYGGSPKKQPDTTMLLATGGPALAGKFFARRQKMNRPLFAARNNGFGLCLRLRQRDTCAHLSKRVVSEVVTLPGVSFRNQRNQHFGFFKAKACRKNTDHRERLVGNSDRTPYRICFRLKEPLSKPRGKQRNVAFSLCQIAAHLGRHAN